MMLKAAVATMMETTEGLVPGTTFSKVEMTCRDVLLDEDVRHVNSKLASEKRKWGVLYSSLLRK